MKMVSLVVAISTVSLYAMEDEINFWSDGGCLRLEVPSNLGQVQDQEQVEIIHLGPVLDDIAILQKINSKKVESTIQNIDWLYSKIPCLNKYMVFSGSLCGVQIQNKQFKFKVPHWFALNSKLKESDDEHLVMFSLLKINGDDLIIIPYMAGLFKKNDKNQYEYDCQGFSFKIQGKIVSHVSLKKEI